MPKKRKKEITSQKLREILRLRLETHMGYREIARSCAVSHVTVMAWLKPVEGLTWEEVKNMGDSELKKLVKGEDRVARHNLRPEPDWSLVHKELSKKGVTLRLLWEEYKESHPDGYQSTQFYKRYRDWKKTLSPWMRQNHKEVRIRHTQKIVEIFFKSKRVASHMKSSAPGRHTTIGEHMPKGHREHMEWNPSRIMRWAEQTGKATLDVVSGILSSRLYPEQGYRSCLGIMRLGKHYGNDRLEAACRRAVKYERRRYKYIKNILEKGLDKQPFEEPENKPPVTHNNIRGGKYFE